MIRLTAMLIFFCSLNLGAQTVLKEKVQTTGGPISLTNVLEQLKDRSFRVYYLAEWTDPISVTVEKSMSIQQLLERTFEGSDYNFFAMDSLSLVLVKDPTRAIAREKLVEEALDRNQKVESYQFGSQGNLDVRQVTLSGTVVDLKTEDPMPYVSIQPGNDSKTFNTDENGQFSIALAPGPNVLTFRFLEYENSIVDVEVYEDATITVDMEKESIMLNEVVIQDKSSSEQSKTRIGVSTISVSNIKKTPSFLGEPDLVKSIQRLPGVTTVGEAASGFNVRGGSVDQNLILYDGIPVFNSAHVFGFFSAFNPDGISDVNFYRGGIPAEYGGRSSSVLNIRSKDGDFEDWHFKGGIGLITSNLHVNGPLVKSKTSLSTSVRSTYSDWLVHSIRTDYADLTNSTVQFYDASAKVSHLFNNDAKLSVTAYASNDAFRLVGDTTYQWNNYQLSAKYNRQFSPQFSGEFVAGTSSYGYDVFNDDSETASKLSFRILTNTLKAGFLLNNGAHTYSFGWNWQLYHIQPGAVSPNSAQSNVDPFDLDRQVALENAFYASDLWKLNAKTRLEYGVRLPVFTSFGKSTIYEYTSGQPKETNSISDTLGYGSWQPSKAYIGLEPRASLIYQLNANTSLKFGYNTIFQYLHLVSNSTAVTPVDIWQPSGRHFKPQRADQLSLGLGWDQPSGMYSLSSEVFYKNIANLLDFKDGAKLVLNETLETDLLQGKGYAYGAEVSLSKNTGILSGGVNYTFSRSFRKIDGDFRSETINSGERYPSNFDQPHIANLDLQWIISRRVSVSGNFTYHSGRPVTIPLAAIQVEGQPLAYFSGRNQYRIPDYHRLDLALVIEGNYKRDQKWQGTWVFSLYNVYARKNPYSIFFSQNSDGVLQPYQLAIIGTVLPSISYNLKIK